MNKVVDFRCPSCAALYREEDEASDCCPRDWPDEDEGWECGNPGCELDGIHETEREAEECAPLQQRVVDCVCGHPAKCHALPQMTWQGCYDLDCRCPKFEQAQAVAA